MRSNLVDTDLIDCIIGMGANLFYNSTMEACIVICRTQKPALHKGKILFINAINEVTKKNKFNYLDETHINKITSAYESFVDDPPFAKVVEISDIKRNGYTLNISRYFRSQDEHEETHLSTQDAFDSWRESQEITTDMLGKFNRLIQEV